MGKFAADSEPVASKARMECNVMSVLEGDSRGVTDVIVDVASYSRRNLFVVFVGLNKEKEKASEDCQKTVTGLSYLRTYLVLLRTSPSASTK